MAKILLGLLFIDFLIAQIDFLALCSMPSSVNVNHDHVTSLALNLLAYNEPDLAATLSSIDPKY